MNAFISRRREYSQTSLIFKKKLKKITKKGAKHLNYTYPYSKPHTLAPLDHKLLPERTLSALLRAPL